MEMSRILPRPDGNRNKQLRAGMGGEVADDVRRRPRRQIRLLTSRATSTHGFKVILRVETPLHLLPLHEPAFVPLRCGRPFPVLALALTLTLTLTLNCRVHGPFARDHPMARPPSP